MPNIEIHGLNEDDSAKMAEKIFYLIRSSDPELAEQAVVTLSRDICIDQRCRRQPYLRICSSKQEHLDVLKGLLGQLIIDIETLVLQEFIPAQK